MPARSDVRYTYEDYLATPEGSAERYEIIDGELFVTAAPRFRHQEVVISVGHVLAALARQHNLGRVATAPTVRLADDTITEPDVVFVRADRLGIIEGGRIHGVPDLVVEVLSPSNEAYDRTLKRKRYMESGVPELWILDADENTIEVWRPGAAEPESPRDVLNWRVGDRSFDIALSDIFWGS
jgi:Uma2 family endonuclease